VADPKKIQAELSKLSEQQIQAARFVGWKPSELAAYQERTKRIALLRAQLTALGPNIEHLA
jgi:hypothetical protein